MDNKVVVSIKCLVYNHGPYLRQCLDGFVMQKTNFKFEAIVHDDASTDNSAEIIREYAEKYPDIIKPIIQKENCYSQKKYSKITNDINLLIKGKYIAFCEGDDYWTDPYKLQKQVDYLEAHPECGLVYTDADFYYQKSGKKISRKTKQVDFRDLCLGNVIWTLTVCLRKDLLDKYNQEFIQKLPKDLPFGDYCTWLYFAANCKVQHLSFNSAIYRILEESASHSKDINTRLNFIKKTKEVKLFYCNYYLNDANIRQLIEARYDISVIHHIIIYNKVSLLRDEYCNRLKSLKENNLKYYCIYKLILIFPFLCRLYYFVNKLRK